MWKRFKRLFCKHNRRYEEHRWMLKDGTPMFHFVCHDCEFIDLQRVYDGNYPNWSGRKDFKVQNEIQNYVYRE